MAVRPLLWHDWPYVFRHRRQFQSLDNILALTSGAPLTWTSLISSVRPVNFAFTGLYETQSGDRSAVGQIYKSPKMTTAHINYLLTPEGEHQRDLVPLLEGLFKEAGHWGSKQVVAELSPEAAYFTEFRQAGFSVFAKHRLFKFKHPGQAQDGVVGRWRIWTSDDILAMRSLYQTLVPPLIQPVEPLTRLEMLGLVYYDVSGELQAFVDLVYGPVGVWALPFVHPQTSVDMTGLLAQMVADLPDLSGRPVYVVSRSYQPWIEPALDALSAERSPELALLVRHIAIRQRVTAGLTFKSLETGNTEPTFPVTPIRHNRD